MPFKRFSVTVALMLFQVSLFIVSGAVDPQMVAPGKVFTASFMDFEPPLITRRGKRTPHPVIITGILADGGGRVTVVALSHKAKDPSRSISRYNIPNSTSKDSKVNLIEHTINVEKLQSIEPGPGRSMDDFIRWQMKPEDLTKLKADIAEQRTLTRTHAEQKTRKATRDKHRPSTIRGIQKGQTSQT